MKKITVLTVLVLLASCGKKEPLTKLGKVAEKIAQTPRNIGNELLGTHTNNQKDQREVLKKLDKEINQLNSSLNSLYNQINDVNVDQDTIEQTIALNQSRLTSLESNVNITDIVGPCGDNIGKFDEVLLKTDNNEFLAYFEQGGKRFLTKLPNGSYRSTDKQKCYFNINNGNIENERL